ncbi:magnesium transporter [Clostridium sp. USBA 49]|uniref:magnesium/cobalt transporter CorA n=1 Tax=Clostridium sp. USBA 49 TaxID=1881060 RepID=UPI0009993B39|nr:magnesium/cobalt transporter CorA [Clostridium sp. USBA 49]SKA73350.1 magnesium transporter [Clostridium sp. USBA 49]
MSKFIKKSFKKIGESPGTLVYNGEYKTDEIKLTMIKYNKDFYEKIDLNDIKECFDDNNKEYIKWVNIEGLHDVSIIQEIGTKFSLHPLMLEDIVNVSQRPKIDDYENYILVIIKMVYYNEHIREIVTEQVSFVLIDNYIFSFQEFEGDVFDEVRERIKTAKGNIRKQGVDYLLYSLIDSIVDSYFFILEEIGDYSEKIEIQLMENPKKEVLHNIYDLKREMIYLSNSIWPLREVVGNLTRTDSILIKENTKVYLRDVHDHIIQIVDIIESYRDIFSGMLDTYLSSISNKTNEVMKILTIFSSIFIPLTFLAGIYGMNFKYFPELNFVWAYPAFWLVTIIIIITMIKYFKNKKWL